MDYLTHNETETEALGARLAGALSPGAVVAYRGGLGMGKTAFTRGLARGLGYVGRVTSPTFTIVNEYEGGVLTRLTPDRAISLAELAEELRPDARPKIAVGDGARLCADFLNQTGIPCKLAPPHLMMQNAMSVALEAEALALEGRLVDAQALLPVYLRPPQAERLRKAERR